MEPIVTHVCTLCPPTSTCCPKAEFCTGVVIVSEDGNRIEMTPDQLHMLIDEAQKCGFISE